MEIRNSDGIWINSSYFSEEAHNFEKNGYYIPDPWGSSGWKDYWEEQLDRCINGYSVGGAKITGHHYAYLNFNRIKRINFKTGRKVMGFPDFWDGDYNFFWALDIARNGISKSDYEKLKLFIKISEKNLEGNKHMIIAKARRRGYSYKIASIIANTYNTVKDSLCLVGAYESKYANDTMRKTLSMLNFINENTGWKKNRDVINRNDHIRASYMENQGGTYIEKGYMSEVSKIIYKDNPDAGRGKDAYYSIIDEAGVFGTPDLLKNTLMVSKPSLEAGDYITGQFILFGCVCKGTKVWDNKGVLRNIEDITKEDGIIGYAGKGVITENISWLKPPGKKECVRITTDRGDMIECSTDHPLLWAEKRYSNRFKVDKIATFKKAKDIKVGDCILQSLQMPKFGNKRMWNPRLVGLLIGDGYYGGKSSCAQLCVAEKEILDYIKTLKLDYSEAKGKSSEEPFFRNLRFKGTQKQMRLLGLQGQSKQLKRLPKNIWDYNKKSICELLGGYFDADGYVDSQGGTSKKIKLTSVVKELLEEVKVQLYKLGIQCSIYKRIHKHDAILKSNVTGNTSIITTKVSYSLEIGDLPSLRNFRKHIKLLVNKKREKIESLDLSKRENEGTFEYKYKHTIKNGRYFIDNPILTNLKSKKVKSIEYIGMQYVYNLTTDYTHTYLTNNFVSHNTSGDMDSGTVDFADMYRDPDLYGFMPFVNTWDEDAEEEEVGFFHPIYWNKEKYYDANGNSDKEAAIKSELAIRKNLYDKSKSSDMINKRAAEYPLNPTEAFAINSNNDFPVKELQERLAEVMNNKIYLKKGQPVILSTDKEGVVKCHPDLKNRTNPLYEFKPYDDITGCPIIWEQPVSNPPKGLYVIGYDPYRQDIGTSLGAALVYKTNKLMTPTHNTIVAEYVGRPSTFDEYNRILILLAEYYNATIMYENEVPDVKSYFAIHRKLELLESQPDDAIKNVIANSKVRRVYGMHMSEQLLDAGEKYLKTWLLEERDFIDGKSITNLNTINSPALLQELIRYNRKLNTDRISAFYMIMFYLSQQHIIHGTSLNYEANKTIEEIKGLLNTIKN